ncbi:MAG TPA: hypothetical protein VF816_06395 [Rhodocyclaceae bacterium]
MLSMQQCIDLCDLTPEEAKALRDRATLAEIVAIQAECLRADEGQTCDAVLQCRMLRLRDQLLEEVEAAEDFDELERVVHHYCAYARERDGEASGGPDGG